MQMFASETQSLLFGCQTKTSNYRFQLFGLTHYHTARIFFWSTCWKITEVKRKAALTDNYNQLYGGNENRNSQTVFEQNMWSLSCLNINSLIHIDHAGWPLLDSWFGLSHRTVCRVFGQTNFLNNCSVRAWPWVALSARYCWTHTSSKCCVPSIVRPFNIRIC